MINDAWFELYQSYSAVHAASKRIYQTLQQRYFLTTNSTCRQQMVLFGLELLELTLLLEEMEELMLPAIGVILYKVAINYITTDEGLTAISVTEL